MSKVTKSFKETIQKRTQTLTESSECTKDKLKEALLDTGERILGFKCRE